MMYAPGIVLVFWAGLLSVLGSSPLVGPVAAVTLLAALCLYVRAIWRRR